MPRHKNGKNLTRLVDEYLHTSKIHDYYELPSVSSYGGLLGATIDSVDDYFCVKMQPTKALWKNKDIARGIQKRIINSIRNSFLGHCFSGYNLRDTVISVNQVSDKYSAGIFNLKNLDDYLDKTSSSAVRIFSDRMANGYYRIAAKLEENSAVVYVHKSALYLVAFEMLAPFIKEESDREWLVDEMQKRADEMAEIHF